MLNIIIIDDSDPIRMRIKKLLVAVPDVYVVAEAADGEQGIDIIHQYMPHVVILDINMPKLNGLDVLRNVREKYPEMKFLVLTNYSDKKTMQYALELGADHVFDKSAEFEMMVQIVRLHKELMSQ